MDNSFVFLYLSFPILFMLHELEEIAYMNEWLQKKLQLERVPQFLRKMNVPSSRQFTLMVLEEYLLIILIAGICYYFSYHEFYVSVIIAYNIHILVHLGQAIYLNSYVPGLVLGLFSFLVLSLILLNYIPILNYHLLFIFIPLSLVLLYLNLLFIHKLIK